MISCEHVIVQRVVLPFSQLNFKHLYPISLTKIVEVVYAIYQGLSKRRPCKEYVRRKVNHAPGANLHQNFVFASTLLLPQRNNLTWARDPIRKPVTGQQSTSKKHATSMSSKPEPAMWPRDTGQRIACCDSCQLTIVWMPKIKDVAMVMVLLS